MADDMDFNRNKLKLLMDQADNAFEAYKSQPNSQECAHDYDSAKEALDKYLADMRNNISNTSKNG